MSGYTFSMMRVCPLFRVPGLLDHYERAEETFSKAQPGKAGAWKAPRSGKLFRRQMKLSNVSEGMMQRAQAAVSKPSVLLRLRLVIHGAVQGVGFRPFVYRLASDIGLKGWVVNSAQGKSVPRHYS